MVIVDLLEFLVFVLVFGINRPHRHVVEGSKVTATWGKKRDAEGLVTKLSGTKHLSRGLF